MKGEIKMFGKIELQEFEACKLPQAAASAWTEIDQLTGASYRPLLFVGTQITRGLNYIFIAEQTLITAKPETHLTMVVINEFNGEFEIVDIEKLV